MPLFFQAILKVLTNEKKIITVNRTRTPSALPRIKDLYCWCAFFLCEMFRVVSSIPGATQNACLDFFISIYLALVSLNTRKTDLWCRDYGIMSAPSALGFSRRWKLFRLFLELLAKKYIPGIIIPPILYTFVTLIRHKCVKDKYHDVHKWLRPRLT